jgi:hypothetical protein
MEETSAVCAFFSIFVLWDAYGCFELLPMGLVPIAEMMSLELK